MRKIIVSSIIAVAGMAFAASAWADCAGHVASKSKPVVTAESGTTPAPTTTDSKKGG